MADSKAVYITEQPSPPVCAACYALYHTPNKAQWVCVACLTATDLGFQLFDPILFE